MTLSLDRVLDQHTMILEVFQDFIERQARYLSKSAKQPYEFADNRRQLQEALRQVLNSITVLKRNVQEFLSDDPRKDLEDVPNGGDFADGSREQEELVRMLRDKSSKEFMVAAVVFGIFSLIAQIFAGLPSNRN
ncbi:hypothetical protein FNYG_06122 [Fusarium nygamai]|uniref:Uncharacterized protein n=1 Tax=Gibberella nygamai TaxID=42673 RepID=A0A2K0WE15_GIBNY|nr:hypothetical protein FNYG_06122 [Fusarium nygamai]